MVPMVKVSRKVTGWEETEASQVNLGDRGRRKRKRRGSGGEGHGYEEHGGEGSNYEDEGWYDDRERHFGQLSGCIVNVWIFQEARPG